MVKNSFVDYPGEIACVIFTIGCNFRCWYCHNSHLFYARPTITEEEVFEFLREHKPFLDGVVVSGGEPTLQSDLIDFIKKVKEMGYKVKLDTNGTDYYTLKSLIDEKLVDYVAMDIKAPISNYKKVVMKDCNLVDIQNSINLLKKDLVDYEFRTTFSPDLSLEDMEEICKEIEGAKRFSIQEYRVVKHNKVNMMPRPIEDHYKARDIAKKYVKEVILKGVE